MFVIWVEVKSPFLCETDEILPGGRVKSAAEGRRAREMQNGEN